MSFQNLLVHQIWYRVFCGCYILKTTIAGMKYSEIYLFLFIFVLFIYSLSRVDKNHDFFEKNQKKSGDFYLNQKFDVFRFKH